ncbi:unnamed protein product, partial [marine sediment metagenome]
WDKLAQQEGEIIVLGLARNDAEISAHGGRKLSDKEISEASKEIRDITGDSDGVTAPGGAATGGGAADGPAGGPADGAADGATGGGVAGGGAGSSPAGGVGAQDPVDGASDRAPLNERTPGDTNNPVGSGNSDNNSSSSAITDNVSSDNKKINGDYTKGIHNRSKPNSVSHDRADGLSPPVGKVSIGSSSPVIRSLKWLVQGISGLPTLCFLTIFTIAVFLPIAKPVQAAQFLKNAPDKTTVLVQTGDTFGHIVEKLRVGWEKTDAEGYR